MTLLWDLWYSHLSAQQTKTAGFAAYAQRWRWGCKNGNSTRSSSSKVVVIVQGFQKGVRQPTSRKPLRNRQSQNCLKDRRVPNMENRRGPLNRRIKRYSMFAALEFWRQLISSPGLNLQDWLEHTFRNSQPASWASQPRTSHQAASQSARHSNTIWEWGTVRPSKTMGLKNEANYCSNINFTPNNAFCSPCILQTFHIYRLSICGGHHHHHHHHVGCHGTQRRPQK